MVVHILRSRYKSDSCGMTPLHYAAQNKQNGAKTSEHLLNKASYALINWQDHKGRTALHLGIVPNGRLKRPKIGAGSKIRSDLIQTKVLNSR